MQWSIAGVAIASEEILAQLHEVGSPATVSQIGGRYFGLVSRISVCSWATTKADVTRSVKSFIKARKQTKC